MNIAREVTRMNGMTVSQLRTKYAEVFVEPTNSRHKEWLIKRIAWRMQANEEGDLSERARKRAAELANDADLRMTPPRQRRTSPSAAEQTLVVPAAITPSTELLPGTVLQRPIAGTLPSLQ